MNLPSPFASKLSLNSFNKAVHCTFTVITPNFELQVGQYACFIRKGIYCSLCDYFNNVL